MLRILTCFAFVIFVINFEQGYTSNEINSMVSAEPVQNRTNDKIQDFVNFDNEEEDEVLVRVKRMVSSRYSGRYNKKEGEGSGNKLSTGAGIGIVLALLLGVPMLMGLLVRCCC